MSDVSEGQRLINIARDLRSEDGENPEYDRALVEVVGDFFGYTSDHRGEVEKLLGIRKTNTE